MSDLVERLRALVILDEVRSVNTLGQDAADRIEALEASLREIADEMKVVQQKIADPNNCLMLFEIEEIARAALDKDEGK